MQDQAALSLDSIPLLSVLSAAERDKYARLCRWKRFQPQEQIIDSQSDSRDVFFVVQGLARVVNFSLSGREITLDYIGPGGYFGELAALDGMPRSASIIAQQETVTASLTPEHFQRLLRDNPDVALTVMKGLTRVIRQSTDRIMDLSTLGANNRVHAELLRIAADASSDRKTAVIKPFPVHSDIASRVSTTRETVARVLSELTRARIIKREKDALVILDIGQLERLVQDVRGG